MLAIYMISNVISPLARIYIEYLCSSSYLSSSGVEVSLSSSPRMIQSHRTTCNIEERKLRVRYANSSLSPFISPFLPLLHPPSSPSSPILLKRHASWLVIPSTHQKRKMIKNEKKKRKKSKKATHAALHSSPSPPLPPLSPLLSPLLSLHSPL